MPLVAQVFAVVAGALHVLFFVMESVVFRRPPVWTRFGVRSQHDADVIRPMAYNQGFYNLFLAAGAIAGVVLSHRDGDAHLVGEAFVGLACGSMVLAALVLASTGLRYAGAAVVQGLPPLLALLVWAL